MKLALTIILTALTGCAGSASRAQARGAVLVAAEAVLVGDKTCAQVALDRTDLALARVCEAAYDRARASVITAAAGVDAWDNGKRGDVACAVQRATNELTHIAKELRDRRVDIPKVVDDALGLAATIGGCK